jgi:hypothetical protein
MNASKLYQWTKITLSKQPWEQDFELNYSGQNARQTYTVHSTGVIIGEQQGYSMEKSRLNSVWNKKKRVQVDRLFFSV